MNLLATDAVPASLSIRLPWNVQETVHVAGSDPWLRASRRPIEELQDEQNHRIPLRDELWLVLFPPRPNGIWRCEAESLGPSLVGRGSSPDRAISDWKIRFRAVVQRFLEMRPFEMTDADTELWRRIQTVIDVVAYKATKPMVIRQVGEVVKIHAGAVVVRWEDGAREKVNPDVFDEAFSNYAPGQRFEATITRNPITFRMTRATAVRKLESTVSNKASGLWEKVVGHAPATIAPEIDEKFWFNE